MSKTCLTLLAFLLGAMPLAADPYRLVIGDRVIVDYDFLDDPRTTTVDLDGNIRLAELGSIEAVDQTLNDIEAAIANGMIKGGFSGVSYVSVEIAEYSPVVVSGFVERSGRYEYLPGMTVGAALAIAGGLGSDDAVGPNADLQAVSARRRAATAAEMIAAAVTNMARLEASLAGSEAEVRLDETRRAAVPASLRAVLDQRLEAERQQLTTARARAETLTTSWDREISDFEQQITLLDERIKLKEETVARLEQELADLDSLRAQGLTTTARLSTLQQRLSDDREELLTLETAKIGARRAASLAGRNRDQFLADRQETDLEDLEAALADFEAGQRDYRFALNELAVLEDITAAMTADQDAVFEVRFVIEGPRAARLGGQNVDRSTPILPGDILVVEVLEMLDAGR